ncbi:hypothetical protein [Vibrio sp. SCSIO 43136]|nr:hypothetical protein [Vibrio sp. SCSIO 43136]
MAKDTFTEADHSEHGNCGLQTDIPPQRNSVLENQELRRMEGEKH